MRNHFDRQLDKLHIELTTMGGLCEQAIAVVAKAMLDRDVSLLPQAYVIEHKIDRSEREIEGMCMNLLLCQQPVAGDLRTVSTAMRVIADMERIGDQAADIAEILTYSGGDGMDCASHIGDMARSVIKMVTDSVEAFVRGDLEMARATIAYDDVVDSLFDQVKAELTSAIARDPDQGGRCLDFLMIAKYMERIGDHAVNVAEWVCYALTGLHPKNVSD